MKIKKISIKITLAIVLVGVMISTIISGVVGYRVSKSFTEEALEKAKMQVAESTREFEKDFTQVKTAVEMMGEDFKTDFDLSAYKSNPEYLAAFEKDYTQSILNISKNLQYADSVYLYFNSQYFGKASDIWFNKNKAGEFERHEQLPLSYFQGEATPDKDWYFTTVQTKQARWTAPYLSESGDIITSFIQPVLVDDQVIALAGMDFILTDMSNKLSKIKLYDTGYITMMDDHNNYVVHPKMDIGTNASNTPEGQQIIEASSHAASGYSIIVEEGVKNIVGFVKLDNNWTVVAHIPLKEVTGAVNKMLLSILIIALCSIAISILIAFWIGRNISKPITQVTEVLSKVKEGDFTVISQVNTCDETSLLSNGLNEMIHTMRALIGNTKSASINMADAATNLASMSQEASATADEVARTINEIAEGASNQAQDAEDSMKQAAHLDQLFKTLEKNSERMSKNAENAMTLSQQGSGALRDLKSKSDISKKSNTEVSVAVELLDEKASSISSIVEAITSIADQTNLLALNASIEAARAGEAGRGFAVVADEIRKLAENSASAANQIQQIIDAIQRESKDTVRIMKSVEIISNDQNQAVDVVEDALAKVFASIDEIANEVEALNEQFLSLSHAKEQIIGSIENISAVSEETAAASEEVSASMEQQSMSVEEVAKNAEQLNLLSMDLTKLINQFKI